MAATTVKKLTFDELFNSTTMFFVDAEFEKAIAAEIQDKVEELYLELQAIETKDGLKKYIVKHPDALDNLTSLMEISTERFKRMVSMIRKDRGFVFGTEWSLGKTRTAMMESPAMMESVLDLIWEGRDSERLKSKIPAFYLDNMVIDKATLMKLKDKDSIRRFVKQGFEGKYSNGIGDLILERVEQELRAVCAQHGLDYQPNVRVPMLDRSVSFVVESPYSPKVIIDVSYFVTTSSSQSDKKKMARETEAVIKKERAAGRNIIYINFLDGAGWLARQSDMKEIHRCSDHVINFSNLGHLADIIDEMMSHT